MKCRDAPCLLSLLFLFVYFLAVLCHLYFSVQYLVLLFILIVTLLFQCEWEKIEIAVRGVVSRV